MVTVRLGTEKDVIKVNGLWMDMVKETNPENRPNVRWWRAVTLPLILSGALILVVAENEEGEVIGFADVVLNPEASTGKIHSLGRHFYVDPRYRDFSTANKLYQMAEEESISRGAEILQVFCGEELESYYKRKGYKQKYVMYTKEVCHA